MRLLYNIGIFCYTLGIRVAALFGHVKAQQMVVGWRGGTTPAAADNETPVAWFHAASLGEFEQARPLMEEYRRRHPEWRILLTFFSPSGYEVRKNYAGADTVLYLPPDLPSRVRRFVDTYRPKVAFFVKYEFWYNYLGELHRRGIPTYFFSVILRPGHYLFRWYGRWCLGQLARCADHIFVQDEESLGLLQKHGVSRCSLAGDTRFDRVHQIAQASVGNDVVEAWLEATRRSDAHPEDDKVIVAGSSWPPDEQLLARFVSVSPRPVRLILAPHVVDENHLRQIESRFPDSVRYSRISNPEWRTLNDGNVGVARTLVIDNVGMLAQLYRYADVAYVGGGFGVGIHNILEAVTFGKPVIFGPNYGKFKEARDIIALGGGWSVADADALMQCLAPLVADSRRIEAPSQACLAYMRQHLGSTCNILDAIEK